MQLQLKILLILAGFAFLLMYACDDYVPDPKSAEEEEEPQDPADTSEVSFSGTLIPILEQDCGGSSCHTGGPSPNFSVSDPYDEVIPYVEPNDPEGSILFDNASGGHYATLEEEDIQKLRQWIEDGAPDN